QQPVLAVAARGGGDGVRVRSGVGFGDAEGHDLRAVGDSGQPGLLLLLGAGAGDDGPADRRGDHHHQQARPVRGALLLHQGELVDPGPAAAVFGGQVHAQEAEPAGLAPQFGQRLTAPGARQHVVQVAVARAQVGHGRAQGLLLIGLDHRQASLSSVGESVFASGSATTASTAPSSTWAPTSAPSSVTTPSTGAATVCSIFIASSHRIGWPAVTVSPTAAPRRITVPGIGASSEPAATTVAGSTNRGSASSTTG